MSQYYSLKELIKVSLPLRLSFDDFELFECLCDRFSLDLDRFFFDECPFLWSLADFSLDLDRFFDLPDRLLDSLRDECVLLCESDPLGAPLDRLELDFSSRSLRLLFCTVSSSREDLDFVELRCDEEALRRSRSSFSFFKSRSRCSRSRLSLSCSRSLDREERFVLREEVWRSFGDLSLDECFLEVFVLDSDLERRGFFGDGTTSE